MTSSTTLASTFTLFVVMISPALAANYTCNGALPQSSTPYDSVIVPDNAKCALPKGGVIISGNVTVGRNASLESDRNPGNATQIGGNLIARDCRGIRVVDLEVLGNVIVDHCDDVQFGNGGSNPTNIETFRGNVTFSKSNNLLLNKGTFEGNVKIDDNRKVALLQNTFERKISCRGNGDIKSSGNTFEGRTQGQCANLASTSER